MRVLSMNRSRKDTVEQALLLGRVKRGFYHRAHRAHREEERGIRVLELAMKPFLKHSLSFSIFPSLFLLCVLCVLCGKIFSHTHAK